MEAVVRVFVLFAIGLCLAIFWGGKQIIWLLYGKQYLGAQAALLFLAPSAGACHCL